MYQLDILVEHSVIKLSFQGTPNLSELGVITDEIVKSRCHFPKGYKLWLVLPSKISAIESQIFQKIDLAAFDGKYNKLKKVVIEHVVDSPDAGEVAHIIQAIFSDLSVSVNIANDEIESRKYLGVLWKKSR